MCKIMHTHEYMGNEFIDLHFQCGDLFCKRIDRYIYMWVYTNNLLCETDCRHVIEFICGMHQWILCACFVKKSRRLASTYFLDVVMLVKCGENWLEGLWKMSSQWIGMRYGKQSLILVPDIQKRRCFWFSTLFKPCCIVYGGKEMQEDTVNVQEMKGYWLLGWKKQWDWSCWQ